MRPDIVHLDKICRRNNIDLAERQLVKLEEYWQILLEWNTKINLISRNDASNTLFNHILHSLSILFFFKLDGQLRVLDLGSGGGLPGIPLAIAKEDLKMTLLDSIHKKMVAVEDMVSRLNLSNVSVVVGRAEDVGKTKPYNKLFDIVISRAVAPLVDLVKWSRPFIKPEGGTLITLKGGQLENEINEAKLKSKAEHITVTNLIFHGSEEMGLEGKKVVSVRL